MLLFYFNLMFWVNTKSFPTQQKGRPVAALFYFNLTPVYEKLLTFVLVALLALSIAIDDCVQRSSTLDIRDQLLAFCTMAVLPEERRRKLAWN